MLISELMLCPIEQKDYRFDSPAIVCGACLYVFAGSGYWESGDKWLAELNKTESPPTAIILPLELPSPKCYLQDLLGYELLSALRWSGPEAIRGVPVLLAAWQPLDAVLRRKPDLLLVQPAIEFVRLPEALLRLSGFLKDVEDGRIQSAAPETIAKLASASDQRARSVSHHDLANDYYAAYRLKKGYLALLQEAHQRGVQEADHELLTISNTRYGWEDTLEAKLRSPFIRRFLASGVDAGAPRYPVVEGRVEILKHHLQQNLPPGTRVLLVDDEFHKGIAEVLLRVLFRQEHFTRQLEDERVFSQSGGAEQQAPWARFVCVRSAQSASNWLAYWDGIACDAVKRHKSWRKWLAKWDRELNPDSKRRRGSLDPEDVFAYGRGSVLDCPSAGPRIKSTVVLLDLRLEAVKEPLYSIRDFLSYELRRTIKAEKPALPVIMFTAS